jgi:hypothetical protein
MRKFLIALIGCFFIFSLSTAFAVTPKKWTFLIFLNGNNSLDHFGETNIKEMEKVVGKDDQVNVVVQWASLGRRTALRMLIQPSTNPSEVTSPVIEDLGLVDMGDYHALQDFVKWGVEHYPADHYFVEVWNHGGGWYASQQAKQGLRSNAAPLNDISYDDISGNAITTKQLGAAMSYAANIIGHKVDIYGSDACLMSMIEVATEMSDSVNYFVGSQEVEPGMGWPYSDLLRRWNETANATPSDVSKILVNAYVKAYREGIDGRSGPVTFSALDLNKLNSLNEAVTRLSLSIQNLNAADHAKVLAAVNTTQHFAVSSFKDILHFTKQLKLKNIKALDPKSIAEVQALTKDVVVANEGTKKYANAKGLSIWLPSVRSSYEGDAKRYSDLKFNLNTHWSDMLSSMLPKNEKAVA